jgi:hypothetical protein
MEALFPLGRVLATPGALDAMAHASQTPDEFLRRHVASEWGELDAHEVAENLYGLKRGFRALSTYRTNAGETRWLNA